MPPGRVPGNTTEAPATPRACSARAGEPPHPRRHPVSRRANASEASDFSAIRAEFRLPAEYPSAALAEAERAVADPMLDGERLDATDLPLVTVDPAGAKDLDQAVFVRARRGSVRAGFRVHYAIADVAPFVVPDGALDAEVRRRGQTLYLPDGTVPLHPTLVSEGAGSLLPEQVRPAMLWTIDLDSEGLPVRWEVTRAWVRSVTCLDYDSVQRSVDAGCPHPSIALLPRVGRLRRSSALERGAIELSLPEQQVESDGAGGWSLMVRPRVAVEEWNAEISLLTGMCAARMMLDAGVGVLRTLPDPGDRAVRELRRSADSLGIVWPDSHGTAELLARLDPRRPESLALSVAATRLLRGAGYTAFDGPAPERAEHAGIGAPYAHVTAPLRRLVDRYAAEACLAVSRGVDVPEWVRAALPELPSAMGSSDRTAAQVDRACVNQAEVWAMSGRVGEEFEATVLRAGLDGTDGPCGEVFVADPPVISRCAGEELVEGEHRRVRLTEADPHRRRITFTVA